MFNVRYDIGQPSRRYKKLRDIESRNSILRSAAYVLVEKTGGWLYRRSLTRHKTADRLDAERSGILQFTATSPTSKSKGGGKIYARNVGGDKYSMFISGVPFIQKAFRSLHIFPKKASALTIPLHRDALRVPAREIATLGWDTWIPKGKNVIMGQKNGRGRFTPLYALVKSAIIPRDAQLLPPRHLMDEWTNKAIKEELAK